MLIDRASTSAVYGAEDIPGDVLYGLRVEGTCYCRTELSAPWGLHIERCPAVSFHFVAQGTCWLVADSQTQQLDRGDLVVLPHGDEHWLLGAPDVPRSAMLRLPLATDGGLVTELRHGGGGAEALVLCGGTRFTEPDAPLIEMLPPVLTVPASGDLHDQWIDAALTIMDLEAATLRPGSETVLTRLCDIVVIDAVRSWLEAVPQARTSWLSALRDEHIGPALALIHHQPDRNWTVASLAAAAHLSRSSFAQRFTALVGTTPVAYLTAHRMRLATSLLQAGASPSSVARQVGYGSLAAFSRAYKKTTGIPPSATRPLP